MEKVFKIKQGEKKSCNAIVPYEDYEDLVMFIRLNIENWYYYDNVSAKRVNILFGVTYGLNGEKENSISIGWMPEDKSNYFKLYAYYYNQGELTVKELMTVCGDNSYMIQLRFLVKEFVIYVDNKVFKFDYDFPKCTLNYYNYPSFGCKEGAPWDMDVVLMYQTLSLNNYSYMRQN